MQRCHKHKINCGVKISKEHCWGGGSVQRIEVFVIIIFRGEGSGGRVGGRGSEKELKFL